MLLYRSESGLWDSHVAIMVLQNHLVNSLLTASAHDFLQSYSDVSSAHYVKISTVALPTKRNLSATVLKGTHKQTAAHCASFIEEGIEIDAELDTRQDAAGRIDLRQLPATDDGQLSTQDFNDLKKRLKVSERLNILLESSGNQ